MASVKVIGKTIDAVPSPASYFTLNRTWKSGDRIEVHLPRYIHIEAMPDEPTMQAFLYGPLVLAGKLGTKDLNPQEIVGPLGPDVKKFPIEVPALSAGNEAVGSSMKPVSGDPLAFETLADGKQVTFVPFDRLFNERYSVYWQVS